MPVRLLIVEGNPITRAGLGVFLGNEPDLEIAGHAGSGAEAVAQALALKPDLIILDYRLPDMTASEVIAQLRAHGIAANVLAFSAYADEQVVGEMLDAGARGYVLKSEDPERILEAVRAVAGGEFWVSSTLLSTVVCRGAHAAAVAGPTGRELEVLVLAAEGRSNVEAAEHLNIAEGTVKNFMTSIYDKLGVRTRAEAVAWAWRQGLMNVLTTHQVEKENGE